MTRAPVVWFPSIIDSVKCIAWIDSDEGFQILKSAFDKTSAHVNLLSVFACPVSSLLLNSNFILQLIQDLDN